MDPTLLKAASTECGLNAIKEVLHIVLEEDPEIQVYLRHLHQLVIDADGIYDDEFPRQSPGVQKEGRANNSCNFCTYEENR